jgi:hypothetical protein
MSEHVMAASEFSASLKGASDAPAPSKLLCDRSFLISSPARAAGPVLGGGTLGAAAVAELYSRPTTSSARIQN